VTVGTAFRTLAKAVAVVFLTVGSAPAARGQAIVKANEDIFFRLGFGVQGWADWAQDSVSQGYVQNLFIRRVSLYLGGQVTPRITFYLRTDSPNLGKAPKDSTSFIVEDGYLEWQVANSFILDGGLILIPLCRNCLEQSIRLLTLDYGSYSFLANSLTQSSVGRDTGFQARGYLAGDRIEYRVGVFAGQRLPGSRNAPRWAGRLQYNVFDTEKGQFYAGTYLGKKKVLAIGVGYDLQGHYRAYAGDVFLDLPVAGGNGVTAQLDFLRWDGGTTFPTLSKQDDVFFEGGYYISSAKLMPWGRFESQSFSGSANAGRNQKRFQVGLTWYAEAHNFNIRSAYSRVIPTAGGPSPTNQFTVQLQFFYF